MNLDKVRAILGGTASDLDYLGLTLVGAALIGLLVWNLDEQKRSSRGRQ